MGSSKPKVSVIVPVFNSAKYLSECIDSIIVQTYENLEIILINDGSTDCSASVCDEYALKYPRIKVVHKENGGASSARNRGIEVATGEYIMFVDSDDTISVDMVNDLYEIAEEYESDISASLLKPAKKEREGTIQKYDSTSAIVALLTRRIDCSQCTKLYKASLFSNVRFPEGVTNEDIVFLIKIYSKIKRLTYVSKNYYFYRMNLCGITHSVTHVYDIYNNLADISSELSGCNRDVKEALQVYRSFVLVDVCMKLIKTRSIDGYLDLYRRCRSELIELKRWIFVNQIFGMRFKMKLCLALLLGR